MSEYLWNEKHITSPGSADFTIPLMTIAAKIIVEKRSVYVW